MANKGQIPTKLRLFNIYIYIYEFKNQFDKGTKTSNKEKNRHLPKYQKGKYKTMKQLYQSQKKSKKRDQYIQKKIHSKT